MAAGTRTLMVKFAGDTKALKKATDSASSASRKFGSVVKKAALAAGIGLLAIGAAAFKLGRDAVTGFREHQKVVAQTAAVIKATGGVANVTTKQVTKLSDAIERATGVDGDLIQTGANLLLTFKQIRNEAGKGNAVFDRATQAAVDLSAAGFGSVDSAAKQLGKALNDPLKGITALTRSGVTFTQAQQDQIKALVESGDLLSAQKIILKEIEGQVGGSAKAQMTATDRMMVAWRALQDMIGAALIPVIDKLSVVLTGFIGWMEKTGTPALKRFGAWIKTNVVPRLKELAAWVREHVLPRLADFGRFITGTVVPALRSMAEFIIRNRDFFVPFVTILGVALVAFKAFMFIRTVIAAVWAFNLALAANPIGLVVIAIAALVAGLIYAYKNSETFRKIVDAAFRGVAAVGLWLWNNVLKPAFRGIVNQFKLTIAAAKFLWEAAKKYFGFWKGLISTVVGWVAALPGRVKSALSGLGNAISAPFRVGFDAVKRFWNNTIGGKGFDIPSWVPFGIGGKSFRFPRFHQGGVVPGPLGREVPILARAGERVLTREQDQAAGGGEFTGTLVLDSGQFLGVVRGQISRGNRELKRRTLTGAGVGR